jgi:hypothetical protein
MLAPQPRVGIRPQFIVRSERDACPHTAHLCCSLAMLPIGAKYYGVNSNVCNSGLDTLRKSQITHLSAWAHTDFEERNA